MRNGSYQKFHGLPGIAQIKGNDGVDGNQGRNIYFGNISDYFDSVEIEVDNFIRLAHKQSGITDYYTGVFDNNMNEQSYIEEPSVSGGNISNPQNKNQFEFIYNIENYKTDRYKPSYDEDGLNILYTKVNLTSNANLGLPWGSHSETSGITDTYFETGLDPLTQNNYEPYDYMPGRNYSGKINGFELFTINDDSKGYTYSTENERYDDAIYNSFKEPGTQQNLSTAPLKNLIQLFKDGGSTEAPVNYIKYGPKAVQKIVFTNRLKDNIKAGDVIYFYTDANTFEYDALVEYMVVITKALEGCTLQELIDHASIIEPFSFKYIDEINVGSDTYISTTNKITSVCYDGADSDIRGKNLANYATYGSSAAYNIANATEDNNKYAQMCVFKTENSQMSIYSDTGQNTVFNTQKNGQYIPLKIKNLKIRNNNIGNVESSGCFVMKHIKSDDSYRCYTINEGNYDSLSNTIVINSTNILKDTTYTDFTFGVIDFIYDSDYREEIGPVFTNGEYTTIRKYDFGNSSNVKFSLVEQDGKPLYGDNTEHMILMWVCEDGFTKRYSYHTIAKYDAETDQFDISILEDGNVEETDDGEDEVIFDTFGVSPDHVNGYVEIKIPYYVLNGEELKPTDIRLFVNSSSIGEKQGTSGTGAEYITDASYKNSWFTIERYQIIDDNTEVEPTGVFTKYITIKAKIEMEDNIPQFSTNSTLTDNMSASEYNSNPGATTQSDGCDLFNTLMSGKTVSTKQRSVLLTVKYNKPFVGRSAERVAHYKLSQPGFTDNRKIPVVDISIDKQLKQLESANNVDNGVMCNQFQFYVNVAISDFKRENWGSYEDDITLNFDIKNVGADYKFIEKYSIESASDTYAMHVYKTSGASANNYCSIKTYLVDNSVGDPYNMTQNELDESHVKAEVSFGNKEQSSSNVVDGFSGSTSSFSSKTYTYNYDGNNKNVTKKYMKDFSVFNTPEQRDSGLRYTSTIQFRNITFDMAKDGLFRFRVIVEMGNPEFSYLMFRYFVSDMWVSYKKPNSSEYEKFYVGTNNLAKMKQTGRLTTYDYMYATDTLYAYICPVSMTAVPDEYYKSIGIYDHKYVTGSSKLNAPIDDQLTISLNKYIPEIEKIDDNLLVERFTNEQIIPWQQFGLKKRYFQDNVRTLSVKAIHISQLKDKLSKLEMLNYFSDNAYDKYSTIVNDLSYMGVMFNSGFYGGRMIKDENRFYYNEELYLSSKYGQIANNAPCMIAQEADYEIRDAKLQNSVDVWNHEYKLTGNTSSSLVLGNNTIYGNGYEYLLSSADSGQYTEQDNCYTLSETRQLNEEYIFDAPYNSYAYQLKKNGNMAPDSGKWYRTLLCQLKWMYPKHYIDEKEHIDYIHGYDIVDGYSYISGSASDRKFPYNLTYSIYPRCAYDDEHDTAIVFMLRCPSVCEENQYEMQNTTQHSDFHFDTNNNNSAMQLSDYTKIRIIS